MFFQKEKSVLPGSAVIKHESGFYVYIFCVVAELLITN